MLVLTRRLGQEIVIADDIRVKVLAVSGKKVRLGITAATSICVDREEVHAQRHALGGFEAGTPTPMDGGS